MPETTAEVIPLADLPALGEPLLGGIFAGVTTQASGAHIAVVLLPDQGSDLTWKKAMNWAEKLGGVLPSRPVAAMLFANVKKALRPKWHWTSETHSASYAWNCYFYGGNQFTIGKSYEGSAVAVRLIQLSA